MTQREADLGRIEEFLRQSFVADVPQSRLLEAMRYSLLSGGKRIRPILTLSFCRACGGDPIDAVPAACALEMVHTYSLIHDDLPCMDDDDLRRGKPTNHKIYGEAGAVLAGDGLLTAAFSVLAAAPGDAERRIKSVELLAEAAGPYGMVGGQQLDLEGETRTLSTEELLNVHRHKTGDMIRAACLLGVLWGKETSGRWESARIYADSIGLAFQIRDDLLDSIGDPALLGKNVGVDARMQKSTFPRLLGEKECLDRIHILTQQAIDALEQGGFVDCESLKELALELENRNF